MKTRRQILIGSISPRRHILMMLMFCSVFPQHVLSVSTSVYFHPSLFLSTFLVIYVFVHIPVCSQSCLTTTCSRMPTSSWTTCSTPSPTCCRRRRARSDSRMENWCRTEEEEEEEEAVREEEKGKEGRRHSRRGSTRSSREHWPTRRAASTVKLWVWRHLFIYLFVCLFYLFFWQGQCAVN